MTSFIIRRLIQTVIILIIVSMIVFLALRVLPGDPIVMLVSQSQLQDYSAEQIEKLRHEYGLDKSIPLQYIDWLKGAVHGDLGKSITNSEPVTKEILKRLPITIYLGILSFVLGIVIGIPAGIISAVRRGGWLDNTVTFLANIGITIPVFWLAVLLVYLFSLKLGWLPVFGYTSPFEDFAKSIRQIILPVICLSIFGVAGNARQTRSSMLEVMRQDYIRTAWSKGLKERIIIFRHALKNGLIPVITLVGMGISTILGGSVLVETVFAIPGMGRLLVTSVFNHDYPYVQAIVLMIAIVTVLANFLVDLSYGFLDPRVRLE
ncbi:MAG: ABC transporter permease [Dehalococcoidales bacterium]|nr:ABC transporter permease [Dehalococcoidales bacterium]